MSKFSQKLHFGSTEASISTGARTGIENHYLNVFILT